MDFIAAAIMRTRLGVSELERQLNLRPHFKADWHRGFLIQIIQLFLGCLIALARPPIRGNASCPPKILKENEMRSI
jgi:hypothetical protein